MAFLSTGLILNGDVTLLGLAHNDVCAEFSNQVGGQNEGVQATSGYRATVKDGRTVNNKMSLRFDGADDNYSFSNILAGKTKGTFYALGKVITVTGGGGIWATDGGGHRLPYNGDNHGYEDLGTTVRVDNIVPPYAFTEKWFLWTVVADNNDHRIYFNDTNKSTKTSNTVAFPSDFLIGKNQSTGGNLYELLHLLVYDVAHTPSEVIQNFNEFVAVYDFQTTVTPAAATIPVSTTQLIKVGNLNSEAKWRIISGGGTLSSLTKYSALYNAPASATVATIRGEEIFWGITYNGSGNGSVDANNNLIIANGGLVYADAAARILTSGCGFRFPVTSAWLASTMVGATNAMGLREGVTGGYWGIKSDGVVMDSGSPPTIPLTAGDVLEIVLFGTNQVILKKNGTTVHTFANTSTWAFGSYAPGAIAPAIYNTGSVGTITYPPCEFVGSASNFFGWNYVESVITATVPLTAGFTLTTPNSIMLGQTLTVNDNTTGGGGTKVRTYEIDGFAATPANGNYVNPTFTGIAAGLHTLSMHVEDDTGEDDFELDFLVGTVTGASYLTHNSVETYSSNVPTARTWTKTGSGSINGATGEFTAPSSGDGYTDLVCTNNADNTIFATKRVYYGAAYSANFNANAYYLSNTNFTLTGTKTGGVSPFTYEWTDEETEDVLGTSANLTLNLPAGNYTVKYKVTDALGQIAEHTESFQVVDVLPFNFVTENFNFAVTGSAYSAEIEYEGGMGTPTFEIFRGAIPTGMTLASDGTLSGTPTVAGLYVFEIIGEDEAGTKIYRRFTLLVKAAGVTAFTVYRSAATFRAGARQAETNILLVRGDILGFWIEHYNAAGSVTFSDGGAGGEFVAAGGNLTRYYPANKTQIVTFTISDGTTTRTLSTTFYATQPLNAQWGSGGSLDRETKEQKAKGGTSYFREEDNTMEFGQMDFNRRETYELDLITEFFAYHRKVKRFYYLDMDTGKLFLVRYTSELKWRKNGADDWDIFLNAKGYYTTVKIDLTGYDQLEES